MSAQIHDTFHNIEAVLKMIGLRSPCTVYRLMKRDSFPRPIKVGSKSVWSAREIEAWMTARAAAPRTAA